MRGQIKACDGCRRRKVGCDGANPCKYCSNHSLECSHTDIPKGLLHGRHKEAISAIKKASIVRNKYTEVGKGSRLTKAIVKDKNTEVESRLSKVESTLENILKRLEKIERYNSNYSTMISLSSGLSEGDPIFRSRQTVSEIITNTGTEREARVEDNLQDNLIIVAGVKTSSFEIYDKLIFGNYISASFYSVINGLMWATGRLNDPLVMFPVKNLISNFIYLERNLLSVWTDPVDSSRLSLPSKEIMNIFIESFLVMNLSRLAYAAEIKELANRYYDYKDGLSPQPKYSYGELLFLSSSLLIGSTVYSNKLQVGFVYESILSSKQAKIHEKLLLDNALYYFHRVSTVCDGIAAIRGLTLLCLYAHLYDVNQPFYSMASYAVKSAQEFQLHRAEYYHNLSYLDRSSSLSLWWVCYYLDKISALKTGRLPIIDDEAVTAPALPDMEEYCDISRDYGPAAGLRRNCFHNEISQKFNYMMSGGRCHYRQFYFIMEVDLSIIVSKMYKTLLSYDSSTPPKCLGDVKELLNDLENWKLCFPQPLSHVNSISRYSKMKQFDIGDICQFFVLSDLNINYYYVKLVMNMLGAKSATGLEQKELKNNALESARHLLRLAVIVGQRALQVAGFSIFYSFNAFLTIAAFCIQEPTRDGVIQDVKCLVFACRGLFACFTRTKHSTEKLIMVGAVTKCVLYIVVHVVMEHNKNIHFDLGDILCEVSEIQKSSNFRHLSSYFQDVLTTESYVYNDRVSETPTTFCSSNINFNASHVQQSSRNSFNSGNLLSSTSDFDNFVGLIEEGLPIEADLFSKLLFHIDDSPSSTNGDGIHSVGSDLTSS